MRCALHWHCYEDVTALSAAHICQPETRLNTGCTPGREAALLTDQLVVLEHGWVAPARVPAVLETPMTTPAYLGAMSMWFTEKPPRAQPQQPRVRDVTRTPCRTPLAMGMRASDPAAPQNPTCPKAYPQLEQLPTLTSGAP